MWRSQCGSACRRPDIANFREMIEKLVGLLGSWGKDVFWLEVARLVREEVSAFHSVRVARMGSFAMRFGCTEWTVP